MIRIFALKTLRSHVYMPKQLLMHLSQFNQLEQTEVREIKRKPWEKLEAEEAQ